MAERGYQNPDGFGFTSEDDYTRRVEQGRAAYEVGNENFEGGSGANNLDDQRDQLSDMITHMLHFARLHGLLDGEYGAEQVWAKALMNFNAENPVRLTAWMRDLRVELPS